MHARTGFTAKRVGVLTLALIGLGIIVYPVAYEEGWPVTLIGLTVATVIAGVAVSVARRNEPLALMLDQDDDERRTLLRLRAQALAGRVAVYSSLAIALLLALLDTLARQRGVDTTVMLPVAAVNTYGSTLAVPVLIYAITRALASFFLSRKG
jgi:hypothetical protein